jgi:voltage-gated potassium channel
MILSETWKKRRKRTFEIIEIGAQDDFFSRVYDVFNMLSIVLNLTVCILYTFEEYRTTYGELLATVEAITVAFFAVDFILRLCTANHLYPKKTEGKALLAYLTSFKGLVDIFSFLPYYLPIFFPSGAAAFRIFRVMRFFFTDSEVL